MQITTKLMIAFLIVTVVSVTSGFSAAPKSGEKWNGGKPHAPVEIELGSPRVATPGADLPLSFRVTPTADCKGLKIRLRGLGGVQVTDESEHLIPECVADQPVTVSGMAQVPSQVQGSVAIDVVMLMDGAEHSMSRSVPVAASDASRMKVKSAKQGDLKVDTSSGENLIIAPADKR